MAVTTGTTTSSTNTGKTPDKPSGGGGPGGGSLSAPARTAPSASPTGQRGAGSNTGPGSARPGTTSSATTKPSSSASPKTPSTGPGGGSLQAPARTAPSSGITRPASSLGSGTATAWGGPSVKTTAPGRDDRQPSTGTKPSAKVTDPSRSPSATDTAWGGPRTTPQTTAGGKTNLGGLTITGSLLGRQPTSPSLSQVVAQDPISYNGPRAGTTAAMPQSRNPLGSSELVTSLANSLKKAQQGTLLSDYARPEPKIVDRVPQESPPRTRSMAAGDRPISLPGDPRTPPMQSIPEPKSMKLVDNPTLSPSNPFGAISPAQAARLASLQTRIAVDDLLNGVAPSGEARAPAAPKPQGQVNPMYRDPAAQANAVRMAVALGLGPRPASPSTPTEINIPGYPDPARPVSQPRTGNVFNRHSDIESIINNTKLAAQKARNVGDDLTVSNSNRTTRSVVSPSQQGDYPPDVAPSQNKGRLKSVSEVKNRAEYEYNQAKQGLKDLPGRLADAILNGDLRPYDGVQNDNRSYADRTQLAQNEAMQNAIANMPPDQQAYLVTLLMSLIQQQASGNPQADLVNKTFI